MSLKAFHIAFIAVAVGLTAAFALWSLRRFMNGGATADLGMAAASGAACAALVVYGLRVRGKLKDFGWL